MNCPKCNSPLNMLKCHRRKKNSSAPTIVKSIITGKETVYLHGVCGCGQKLMFICEDEETTVEAT